MAERLTALGTAALLLAISAAVPAALAQPLGDPMRPPATAAAPAEEGARSESAARVQSVLISPTRRLAIIDGRMVSVGQRLGDATVVAIAESGVTLERLGERRTLKLHPGVDKKPVPSRDQVNE